MYISRLVSIVVMMGIVVNHCNCKPIQRLSPKELLDLGGYGNNVNIIVLINNHLSAPLENGSHYLHYGIEKLPVHRFIEEKSQAVFMFEKVRHTATGSSGALGYTIEVEGTAMPFIIVWSIPYDFNLYNAWFGVAWNGKDGVASLHSYNCIYNAAQWTSHYRGHIDVGYASSQKHLKIQQGPYEITAQLTNRADAILTVDVRKSKNPEYDNLHPDQYICRLEHVHGC